MTAPGRNPAAVRPVTLLIAALGGEGGGVLTDWIVNAASAAGYPVQSTSIPGVAQRTGATTYYIEVFPRTTNELGGQAPVLALYPAPGDIDVMVASELLETGRAMEGGFISPERTTLIASTHRIYSMAEKTAMGDGSYDGEQVLKAAPDLAKRPILSDFRALAQTHGSVINAVLLGAIAEAGVLPISTESLEDAVRASGIAVEANLAGFAAGRASVRGDAPAPADAPAAPADAGRQAPTADDLLGRMRQSFPAECHAVLAEGILRLVDYQDARYAGGYLERLAGILEADRAAGGPARGFALTREAGRHLALWMAYEDVIRVADLKSRRDRIAGIHDEVGAKADEPVRITEFLKPGIDEVAALLPPGLGRRLLNWGERRGLRHKLHLPMRVRTDTVSGYLRLRLLARMRWWRRHSHRFAEEQALMARWFEALTAAVQRDYDLALEVVECAGVLKGYGETHARGRGNFLHLLDDILAPGLAAGGAAAATAVTLREARGAALADPEGAALSKILMGAAQTAEQGDGRVAAE